MMSIIPVRVVLGLFLLLSLQSLIVAESSGGSPSMPSPGPTTPLDKCYNPKTCTVCTKCVEGVLPKLNSDFTSEYTSQGSDHAYHL